MNLQERIEAASAALIRGEDANWEIARLTWESTVRRGERPSTDRLTMADWCERVRASSGRKFSERYAEKYRQAWAQFGVPSTADLPVFSEVMETIITAGGPPIEERRAQSEARKIIENPALLKPEQKRALVEQLAEDPDVRDDWQTRARVQRAIHDGDQRQEQRIVEVYERDPVAQKIEGWRASIRLTQIISQLTSDIGRGNTSIEDALRRDPSDIMSDINMLPQFLPDLEARYAQLGENISRLRSFLDTGSTDIDRFLDSVLKGV